MKKLEPINIFDFDGTLTTETWPKFLVWVQKFGYCGETRNDELEKALNNYRINTPGNDLETFFGYFDSLLKNSKDPLTYEELMEGEQYIIYNLGVKDFLSNSAIKNYIVSGGIKEFLENLDLAKYFAGIYGTPLIHNKDGHIIGIGDVMTDEKKLLAIQDILKKEKRQPNDCHNIYYIGDGYSDAAAMRFVHNNGGKAIFVHQPNEDDYYFEHNDKIYNLLKSEGIVDFYCTADYQKDSTLRKILERKY